MQGPFFREQKDNKRGKWERAAFFFILLSLLQHFLWAQIPSDNSCVACHAETWEEARGSIHSQHGVFCQHCHGGDPTKGDSKLAKAPGTGYIGIPDKKQMVGICGQCHANVEAMNFYDIRTDQLARYKTSRHGKKLLEEGDTHVAACSDCHGYHDVLATSDPSSPVYPSNVPLTCNRCHGNSKLMAHYQLPADIFEIYKSSVHGKALLEKKDIAAAHCTSCHGSHGAIPPGVKEVGTTCGKCHVNEKKYFLESVHASVSAKGKFSECISCHGNHGVQSASKALYEQACLKCHEPEGQAVKVGRQIEQLLREAEERQESSKGLVKQASIEGIFVEEEMAALEEIKSHVIAMAPLQHTLSLARISELHNKVEEIGKRVRKEIHEKRQSLKWRKLALIPIWIFIGMMVSVLWLKYKQLKGKNKES